LILDGERTQGSVRRELEALDGFVGLLQQEYAWLSADFAAVLAASGGSVRVECGRTEGRPAGRIEREYDAMTGAVSFRITGR